MIQDTHFLPPRGIPKSWQPPFPLSERHCIHLKDSGISEAAISARGYFTISDTAEGRAWLHQHSFSVTLVKRGCLAIPLPNWRGEVTGYVLRPDHPHADENEKIRKYEFAPGARQQLDLAMLNIELLGHPGKTLVITEGAKKADAAASHGFVAVSVSGVYGYRGKNEFGGTANLSDLDEIPFKGIIGDSTFPRRVLIAFDSDWLINSNVYRALLRLADAIARRGGEPLLVDLLPGPDGAKTGLDDFFARGGTAEDLLRLVRPIPTEAERAQLQRERHPDLEMKEPPKPRLEPAGQQLRKTLADMSDALIALNGDRPQVFQTAQGLAILTPDINGRLQVDVLTRPGLQVIAAEAADWNNKGDRSGDEAISPPRELCENFLASKGHWKGLPVLEGVVQTPFFAADGTLCARHGYHEVARTFLQLPVGFDCGDTTPTPENVAAANELILGRLFEGVAFADEASRAHAVALLLQPLVRRMIHGATPLYLFDAPTQSSGKSYAARLAIWPYAQPVSLVESKNDEEWEKVIFTVFLEGRSHIFIDNITGRLGSPALASFITEPVKTQRVLGASKTATVNTWGATWVATSNNANLSGDAASRLVKIRIDTGLESPEQRRFKGSPETFVQENRAEVFGAMLTLVNAWIAAGKPLYTANKHRFAEWSQIMGGILQVCGIPDFLANLESERENSSPEREMWRELVAAWYEEHGLTYVTAKELLGILPRCDGLSELIGEKEGKAQRLGNHLGKQRDRVFSLDGVGSLQIQRATEKSKHGVRWQLRLRDGAPSGGEGPSAPGPTSSANAAPEGITAAPDGDHDQTVGPAAPLQSTMLAIDGPAGAGVEKGLNSLLSDASDSPLEELLQDCTS